MNEVVDSVQCQSVGGNVGAITNNNNKLVRLYSCRNIRMFFPFIVALSILNFVALIVNGILLNEFFTQFDKHIVNKAFTECSEAPKKKPNYDYIYGI